MIFTSRADAGRQLAQALKGCNADVVIALPRGGVVVGYEVATTLSLPLEVICPRKIGAPGNPEYAIGAVTEGGEISLQPGACASYSQEEIERLVAQERAEAQRRAELYRSGRAPYPLAGRSVLLVDDGIATGSTMRAAIESVRQQGAQSITVAVPVAPPQTAEQLEVEAIVLMQPDPFYAVGQFYRHFDQTSDQEVINLLRSYADGRKTN